MNAKRVKTLSPMKFISYISVFIYSSQTQKQKQKAFVASRIQLIFTKEIKKERHINRTILRSLSQVSATRHFHDIGIEKKLYLRL